MLDKRIQAQPTNQTQPAEPTTSKFAHKPKLSMIWVTETVGDRTRLVARWTTQD